MENSNLPDQTPQSVLIIRNIFDWCLLTPRKLVVTICLVFLLFSAIWTIYTVKVGYTATVQRFGKLVQNNLTPGLHFRVPWHIDRISKIRTGQIYRAKFIEEENSTLTLLSGDENLIEVQLVAQYRITDIGQFLFNSDQPEKIIKNFLRSSIINEVSLKSVDWVLARGKHDLQHDVSEKVRKILKTGPYGVQLVSLNLISINPPSEALPAFLDVNDAKSDRITVITNATTRKDRTIAHAKGEADAVLGDARAEADARIKFAHASATRFNLILDEKKKSPQQTYITQYRKMAKNIVGRANITVIAPEQSANLNVNILENEIFSPAEAWVKAGQVKPFEDVQQELQQVSPQITSELATAEKQTTIGKAVHSEITHSSDRRAGTGLHSNRQEAHHLEKPVAAGTQQTTHKIEANGKNKKTGKNIYKMPKS